MINIAGFEFNPLRVNTYVVSDPTGECIIIDPGNGAPHEDAALAEYIGDKNLRPVMAVCTHGHADHLLGAEFVARQWGVPLALRGEDLFLVESAPMHAGLYGLHMGSAPAVGADLAPQDALTFGQTTLRLIHTPGHTPGHICLYDPQGGSLFTGDTLFRESIGRTDLPGGDYSWIMDSILEKIMPLGGDVRIFPGHGPASDLGHEALYNPFIVEVLNREVNYR